MNLVFTFESTALTRCDSEWGGEYCDEPVVPLPSQLKDSFSRAPSLSHWHTLTGGKLSTVCGAVASGAALHFSGVCLYAIVLFKCYFLNFMFVSIFFGLILFLSHKYILRLLFPSFFQFVSLSDHNLIYKWTKREINLKHISIFGILVEPIHDGDYSN